MEIQENDRLRLLANRPIHFNGAQLKLPTLQTIIDLGVDRYNQLISILLISKQSFADIAQVNISNCELLYINCLHNKELWELTSTILQLVFDEVPYLSPMHEGMFFYFGNQADNKRLDHTNFDYFQRIIMIGNNVSLSEQEYSPKNAAAAKVISEMQERKKRRPKLKEKITLHSMISGLAWKSNSVSIADIFDLTIYQFYDGFFRMQEIDSHRFTLTGIYTGNIDSKKIDLSKIHWANHSQQNQGG